MKKLTEFGERVVTLAAGAQGLRGLMPVTCKVTAAADNPNNLPMVDFVASDGTLDRYEEVVDPKGWQLENYRRNPVFQNSHQYGDILHTLGKATVTEVRP